MNSGRIDKSPLQSDDKLKLALSAGARRARIELNLTQEKLAERVGLSVGFYARIERGLALPSVASFYRLVVVLDVCADELLNLPDSAQNDNNRHQAADVAAYRELDTLPLRRLMRRLRGASGRTLRLVKLLLEEIEQS
ncbi:MAG: hypothetical protein Tsb0020_43840 [Haliangiales bacterium]